MIRTPAILYDSESGKYLRDRDVTWSLVACREQASVYAYTRDAETRAGELPLNLQVIPLTENLPTIPYLVALGDPVV